MLILYFGTCRVVLGLISGVAAAGIFKLFIFEIRGEEASAESSGRLLGNIHPHYISETRPILTFSPYIHLHMALLLIASRVEAAVRSYVTVKAFTDADIWRENFEREKVSAVSRRSFKPNSIVGGMQTRVQRGLQESGKETAAAPCTCSALYSATPE